MEKPGFQDHNNRKFDNGVFSGMRNLNGAGGENQQYRFHYGSFGTPYRGNGHANRPGGVYPESRFYRERGAGWADNRRTDNTALIVVAIASVFMLFIAFLATLLCLIIIVFRISSQESYGYSVYGPADGSALFKEQVPFDGSEQSSAPDQKGEVPSKNPETGGNHSKEYYGEIRDAIRTDLDYSIEWENYEYEGNNDYIMIEVDYPVIKGDVPNKDIINAHIAKETEYFEEYIEEYSRYMLGDEVFGVYSEGYVTYMDAKVMSVVFCEEIYTDYWEDYTLYCINIDMENGVVINNSDLMKIDSEFVVDFRKKNSDQNGNTGVLEQMTDQEVMYYLTNIGTSVLFYTPLGMEVGINFDEGYLTVTYKDYEVYLQRY